jgi:hypothetical protein
MSGNIVRATVVKAPHAAKFAMRSWLLSVFIVCRIDTRSTHTPSSQRNDFFIILASVGRIAIVSRRLKLQLVVVHEIRCGVHKSFDINVLKLGRVLGARLSCSATPPNVGRLCPLAEKPPRESSIVGSICVTTVESTTHHVTARAGTL